MSWENQNTKKQVYTISRPLEYEAELLASIPSIAKITSISKSTKCIRVTYVIDNTFTINDIVEATKQNTRPITLKRGRVLRDYTDGTERHIRVNQKGIALVNVADFHLNRLIMGEEVNDVDYDINKAIDLFKDLVDECYYRLKSCRYQLEKIIFNTCGDFFNSDNLHDTTTRGTPQHNHVPWKKMFRVGTDLLEYAMIKLSKIAPVEYYYIRGNHDEQVGYYLTTWLEARFLNVDEVRVDDSPRMRKVITYGNNLLVLTHGDEESSLPDLPFIENSEASLYNNLEVITGHIHIRSKMYPRGVLVEHLSCACPVNDEWTYKKAFGRKSGEVSIFYYTPEGRGQADYINTKNLLLEREEVS